MLVCYKGASFFANRLYARVRSVLATLLTRLWTHGGKIGLRGAYTNFLESTVKEVCKAVLLVDLECVARSSSVSCTSPGQLLTDTERLTVSCVTLEGVCGFFL